MKNYVWNIYFKWKNYDKREGCLHPSPTREDARMRVRSLRLHHNPSEITLKIVKEPV